MLQWVTLGDTPRMAVPTLDQDSPLRPLARNWTNLQAGVVGSLAVLAVVLTLGLLAYAPLGPAAARVGLTAAFVTAAVGGLVYAALGRAVLPVAGPSSATALVLASLVASLVADARLAADLGLVLFGCGAALALAGLLQLLLAQLGLARLARLVPRPVLAGFMNGVALLIVLGQLPLVLGLLPGTALSMATLASLRPGAVLMALGSAALILALARWRPHWPAALGVLVAATVLQQVLQSAAPGLDLGPRIDRIATPWPSLLPSMAWQRPADAALLLDHGADIAITAVVLALIGSLESVLNLLAQDQHMDSRHDSRRELRALGVCNVVCGLLGGLPVVMLRARAMAIAQSGGRGRLAPALGSLALGALYLLGAPLLAWLPLSVLSGVMLTVAVGLVDRWTGQVLRQWWQGQRSPELRTGLLVMALVCGVTLWQGFAAGVAVGVLLSMTIFIARMNRSLLRSRQTAQQRPSRRIYPGAVEAQLQPLRQHIEVWELEGALFFGNADRVVTLAEGLAPTVRALVLDLRRLTAVDETGALALATVGRTLQRRQVAVLAAGLAAGSAPQRALQAYGLPLPLLPDADRAIEAAEQQVLGPAAEATLTARPLIGSALLQGLSAAQADIVRGVMKEIRLFDGEWLFRQGDAADGLYVLALGSVSIIGRDGGSTQRFLSISPGMMLGETALLDGGGRSADAVADTFVVLHHLSGDDLRTLERDHPEITSRLHANIARHLSGRLRAASAAWWASQH